MAVPPAQMVPLAGAVKLQELWLVDVIVTEFAVFTVSVITALEGAQVYVVPVTV